MLGDGRLRDWHPGLQCRDERADRLLAGGKQFQDESAYWLAESLEDPAHLTTGRSLWRGRVKSYRSRGCLVCLAGLVTVLDGGVGPARGRPPDEFHAIR